MKSRLLVNGTPQNVKDLKFSCETQGAGYIEFKANIATQPSDVWTVQVDDNGWKSLPMRYAPVQKRNERVGRGQTTYTGESLLQVWSKYTVFYPEYDRGTIGPQSGTDRGIGWMMTAYDHLNDPREPWDRAYNVTRSLPTDFPSSSSASWVSASSDPGDPSPDYAISERKIFRGNLTVSGSNPQLFKFYLSSDEGATLWVGGELMLQTSYTEEGKKHVEEVAMVLYPGTYALGIDTATHVTKGGDGVDPVILSVWNTTSSGDPSTEVWHSNSTNLKACRRNDYGDGSEPPGPTCGAVIRTLIEEAQNRGVCNWSGITMDFTNTTDSYGQAWSQSTERIVRIGLDDYYQFFLALSETDCDIWLEGTVLRAAPKQGVAGPTVTHTTIADVQDLQAPTVVLAQSYNGWVQRSTGSWRAETGLEVGTALSGHTAVAVADSLLSEAFRWDGTAQVVGKPLIDFGIGDTITLNSQSVRVLSVSGKVENQLLWEVEVT